MLRLSRDWQYRGMQALVLENGRVRVSVLPAVLVRPQGSGHLPDAGHLVPGLDVAPALHVQTGLCERPVDRGEQRGARFAQAVARAAFDQRFQDLAVNRPRIHPLAEIGQALVLSEKTARNHVSTILDKLGVENRVGAATYAIQHRLTDYLQDKNL